MADMEFLLSERELAGGPFAPEKKQVSAAELWWLRSPGRDAEWYRENVTPYYGPPGTLPAMGRYKYANQEGGFCGA